MKEPKNKCATCRHSPFYCGTKAPNLYRFYVEGVGDIVVWCLYYKKPKEAR